MTESIDKMTLVLEALQVYILSDVLDFENGIVYEQDKQAVIDELNKYYLENTNEIITRGQEFAIMMEDSGILKYIRKNLNSNISIKETLFSSTSQQQLIDAAKQLKVDKSDICDICGNLIPVTGEELKQLIATAIEEDVRES